MLQLVLIPVYRVDFIMIQQRIYYMLEIMHKVQQLRGRMLLTRKMLIIRDILQIIPKITV